MNACLLRLIMIDPLDFDLSHCIFI